MIISRYASAAVQSLRFGLVAPAAPRHIWRLRQRDAGTRRSVVADDVHEQERAVTEADTAAVARQPIFDVGMDVYGYELLYRDCLTNRFTGIDGNVASMQVISAGFSVLSTCTKEGHDSVW